MVYPQTLPAKNLLDGSKTPATTNGEMKIALGEIRDYLANLLGSTGTKAAALAALGIEANDAIRNLSMAFAVGGNALSMALKTQSNADPSADNPGTVSFRTTTLGSGAFNERKITATTVITIPSGATLSHSSGIPGWLYWYLIDNAGTVEIAVSATDFGASGLVSTTNLTAGANDPLTMYSTNIRSNVPFRRFARTLDTQTTAGLWAATPTRVEIEPFQKLHVPAIRGEAILTCPGTSQLKLSPHKGNIITFPDGDVLVPSTGVTLSPSGTSAGTLYYIYAVRSGIYVGSLEPSTTAPTVDVQSGIKIKTGDPTRVLVGMARPTSGPSWMDVTNQRLVRSWFNDRGIGGIGTNGSGSTASTSYVEVSSAMRLEFLTWEDEHANIGYFGQYTNNTVGQAAATAIGVDSSTVSSGMYALAHVANTSLYQQNFGITWAKKFTEGYHYLSALFQVAGVSGTTTLNFGQLQILTTGTP